MDGHSRRRWLIPAALFLIIFVAGALRTGSFQNFINPEGGFFFYNMDSYDHLRRITLGVHSFPAVPTFDSYAGYPKGTGQLWPPLFDYILSAVSLLFGGSRATIETVGFLANPFFSALTVLLVFAIARKTFKSTSAGIVAALLLAAHPGHVAYTLAAKLDHQVAEPIAVLLLFSIIFFEKGGRLPLRGKMMVSAIIVLAIFLWRGSTLFWGVAFLSVLVRSLFSNDRRLSGDYAFVFTGSALIIAVICLINPWGTATDISFGMISWFHVILLSLFSCVLVLFTITKTRRTFSLSLGAVVISLLGLFLRPVWEFATQLIGGLSFIRGGGDPWIESISEMQGTFSKYDFLYTAGYLTAAWFLTPLATVIALRKWREGGERDSKLISFALWSPLFILGFVLRYTHVAGTLSALAGGYLFSILWERTKSSRQKTLVGLAAAMLFLLPSYPHHESSLAFRLPLNVRYGLLGRDGALSWIRNNTPVTSYYFHPVKQPEYGVLSWWNHGAEMYYVAERPAIATGFGWETYGFYEGCAFMATDRPETAEAIAGKNRIRYVLMNPYRSYLKYAYKIARDGERKGKLPPESMGDYRPRSSIYYRLMYYDGTSYETPEGIVPSLGNYRLLFETRLTGESEDPRMIVSYYKVFEVVRGAYIQGKGRPHSQVAIALPLLTSRGRLLYFYNRTEADGTGIFLFHVPYSTEEQQGGTIPYGKYIISGNGMKEVRVSVTDADVTQGRTVNLF